jgi:hypothetical protein
MSQFGKKSSVSYDGTYKQVKRDALGSILKKQKSTGHIEYIIDQEDSFNQGEEK